MWVRTLALACLLLLSVASTVQAVHIHGDLLPERAAKAGTLPDVSVPQGGELRCGLCGAMHSALPVTASPLVATLTVVAAVVVTAQDRVPVSEWHFVSFSRPPPAVGLA